MYLGSSAIRAMSSSLSLASMVLRFPIVELWCENEKKDGFSCVYVHAAEEVLAKHKDIIVGYYPDHRREHVVSPKVYCLSFFNSLNSLYLPSLSFSYLVMRIVEGVQQQVSLENLSI